MSRQSRHFGLKSFNFLIFFLFAASISGSELISLEKILPNIEVVTNSQDRQRGLMYKKAIPENYGMFFIWNLNKVQCMADWDAEEIKAKMDDTHDTMCCMCGKEP